MNLMPDSEANDDRRCIECDYTLRGLPTEGRCPECGSAYESDAIVVDSTIGHGQHPWVVVPICLGGALSAWVSGCGIMSFALVIYALGVLARTLLTLQLHGRAATRARCVFTRDGFALRKPLGPAITIDWNEVGFCSLNRAMLVRWRRKPFHRSYRVRLSRSRWPFLWSGFKVDTWFDATDRQIEAITWLIKASLPTGARGGIRVEPDPVPQRDGTSFGQFRS
jgi:hypothetical protein